MSDVPQMTCMKCHRAWPCLCVPLVLQCGDRTQLMCMRCGAPEPCLCGNPFAGFQLNPAPAAPAGAAPTTRIIGWRCKGCQEVVQFEHQCLKAGSLQIDPQAAPLGPALGPQPAPVSNDGPRITDLVIQDLRDRMERGKAKYGVYLQPHNGRNALQDVYEEILDAANYLRQLIEEEKAK